MTAKSAQFRPVTIVPFLYEPMGRLSSMIADSNEFGATINASITAWSLLTKELIAVCSVEFGDRSVFRFNKA